MRCVSAIYNASNPNTVHDSRHKVPKRPHLPELGSGGWVGGGCVVVVVEPRNVIC